MFIYYHDVRFHKDLIAAKFVDTPAALAQHAKVVFICLADPTAKQEHCTGKFGVFTRTTKDSSVVDVTATSEYHATLFSQSCRDHKVHLINSPIHGLISHGQVEILLVSGSFVAFTNAGFAMQTFAKHIHYMNNLPLTAPRATTILAVVQATKVLLIAEAMTMATHLGLRLENMQQLISMNSGDIPSSIQAINSLP